MLYDYVVVGSGLFGSVFTHEAIKQNKSVLLIERRDHIGGNCYTECINGINVHKYGAHIFRTNEKDIWNYLRQFSEFNNFVNSPIANYKGELYNLPFNMNTFHSLWGVNTPAEAKEVISSQIIPIDNPSNLEEHVLSSVGIDIYKKLVKGYTEKQWGQTCDRLPASIMRRIPLRFTYNNNYFDSKYQGIPIGGYTQIFEQMIDGAEVRLNTDYLNDKEYYNSLSKRVIFTGAIDEYYGYSFGCLGYRSLKFEHLLLPIENYQGVAVMNFTDIETEYTRIIEHKHFEFGSQPFTVISREYPQKWHAGIEPFYPMEDSDNISKMKQYQALSQKETKVLFGGRLGEYRYYDMEDTIKSALQLSSLLL